MDKYIEENGIGYIATSHHYEGFTHDLRHPCPQPHPFVDSQDCTGLYSLEYQVKMKDGKFSSVHKYDYDCTSENERRIIAVPIQPTRLTNFEQNVLNETFKKSLKIEPTLPGRIPIQPTEKMKIEHEVWLDTRPHQPREAKDDKTDFRDYAGNWPEDYSHENGNYENMCSECKSTTMSNTDGYFPKHEEDEQPGYWSRLKNHPGLGVAIMLTIVFVIAGMTNKSIAVWWHGALFGLSCSLLIWAMVLTSNRK